MTGHVQRLFQHLVWADERALDALVAEGEAPPEALRELAHVVGAEEAWLARIERRAPRLATWPDLTHEDLGAHLRATHAAWAAWLQGLDQERLEGTVTYTNSTGATFTTGIADILLHVCLHGQAHRGKLNLLLRQAGRTPVALDVIAFVRQRGDRDAADAPGADGPLGPLGATG